MTFLKGLARGTGAVVDAGRLGVLHVRRAITKAAAARAGDEYQANANVSRADRLNAGWERAVGKGGGATKPVDYEGNAARALQRQEKLSAKARAFDAQIAALRDKKARAG